MTFRPEYLTQTYTELERWILSNAKEAYAGYYVDHEKGGIIYIGFVEDQQAWLTAFLDSFTSIAPGRLKTFPVPPLYSLAYLANLQVELVEEVKNRGPGEVGLLGNSYINIEGNMIEVGTEDVDAMQRLVTEKFGSDVPIRVHHWRPLPKPLGKSISLFRVQGGIEVVR
jgi:hypothetical protein